MAALSAAIFSSLNALMTRKIPVKGWAVIAPFGVYCFVYPFAMLLLSFDLMPFGMEWMSSLLLAMLGLTAGAWMWFNFGGMGAALSAEIFVLGLGLEYVGVITGVPFGSYKYTGVLVPGLPGGVPLAIGFAWLLVVVASTFTARRFLQSVWAVSLAGAALAVGLDLLLEPVAFRVKHYWQWLAPDAGYYGVPWENFAAWFIATLLLSGAVSALVGKKPLRWTWLPVALYAMNAVLFGVVCLAHGLWWPAFIGLLLIVLLVATSKWRPEARLS